MNEEYDITKENENGRDFKYYILVFQAVFFALLLSAALIIKFANANFYIQVKEEYNKYFSNQTTLNDMFSPADGYSSFDYGYSVYSE